MTVARPFFQLFALLALGCALAGAEFLSEHLSGMTPYTYAQTGHGLPYTPPEQCRLSGLDAVFRHGSRYPSRRAAQAVRGLEDLLARHQDALRLDWMRTWRNPYTNRTAELLCQNGVDELASLGRDYRAKFSSILAPYNPNSVVFTSTFVCLVTSLKLTLSLYPFWHFLLFFFTLSLICFFFETNFPLLIPILIIIPQSTNRKHEQVKVQLHLGMR